MKNSIKIFMLLAVLAFAFTSCKDDDPANVVPCFTFSPEENIQVGDTVFFSNCSEEANEYVWAFKDGEYSMEKDPSHVFTEPGIYDVRLTAINGGVIDSVTNSVNVAADLAYIINYGSYSGDKSTITAYNKYANEVINGYYQSVNSVNMVANAQFAYQYEGNIYFLDNNADGLSWVDAKTFKQTENALTDDFIKPRYCVGYGDYLYVACYGGDVWNDSSLGYIAKYNISTKEVTKIDMPGGPEGMAIVGDKLYIACRYGKQIAEMDLSTDEFTTTDLAGQPMFFKKDSEDNLYTAVVANYGDTETTTGIGYFNTQTNTLEATYELVGILSTYDNIIAVNDDFSKIYVAYSTGWDALSIPTGGIAIFDVESKQFESENLVDNVYGINGIQMVEDNVVCFVSPSTTNNGKAIFYSIDGQKVSEYETGISPIMMVQSK